MTADNRPVPPRPDTVQWLTTPGALDQWLEQGPATALALDTEFERVSTFFPIPGLVQLGLGDRFCLVDPSVAGASPRLRAMLVDPDHPKLLYAMSEDLDLFRHWLQLEPAGMLDLQIGAALAGAGFSVGYARLVESLFGESLDKSATRSDWLARPLTPEQERYALDDVRFLVPLYEWVMGHLVSRGLGPALAEESERFTVDLAAQSDPANYALKLRGGWQLPPQNQAVLLALVKWREQECRERDRPRNRILPDSTLIAIAEKLPGHSGALAAISGVPPVVVRRYGDALLAIIDAVRASGELPAPAIQPPLSRHQQDLYRKVKRLMTVVAEEHDVPVELLAPRRRLEALVKVGGDREAAEWRIFTEGWRGQLTATVIDDIRMALTP